MRRAMRLPLLLALVAAFPAHAQSPSCAPRDAVIARRAERYGEAQAFAGLTATGEVVLIYLSPEGERTWTAVVARTDGMMCMVAAGKNGEVTLPVAPIPGSLN